MSLTDLITTGKEKFYNLIYQGATAFPYSSDLMHISLVGSIPFLAGKYGSEVLGQQIPFFQEHSTAIGFASSITAEIVWQGVMEPCSPYDHPQDKISDLKGIAETGIGAGLAYLLAKVI